MESAEAASVLVSRRESGKLDKRRRINEAASAVFTECGYERATMREIAKRAGVATGTLFLYSADKRSLLLWILNADLTRITEETFAAVAVDCPDDDLVEQLIYAFEARYRYWGSNPDLSLHALQELVIERHVRGLPATHISNYHQSRFVLRERVAELVHAQQQRGRIRAGEDPRIISRVVLAIYNSEIRSWLRHRDPDVAQGIDLLRNLLRLALEGCTAISGRGAAGTSN